MIDYVTISSTGNATDFGNLTQARRLHGGACCNGTVAVFGGGSTPSSVSTIDYIFVATPGDATDFGELSVARSGTGACSGD